jgi:signal peptidase II
MTDMATTQNHGAGNVRSTNLWTAIQAALPDKIAHLIFWPTAILGVALDLWTKAMVFGMLRDKPDQSLSVIDGFLTLRMALNRGAAFGIASGQRVLLVGVSLVALAAIVTVFLVGGVRQRLGQAALGLFAAGVAGNLWDRLFNGGQVRDFIDVVYWPGHHWHTFNVADSMLCVAVGLLAIVSLLSPAKPSQKPAPPRKSEP